MSDWKWTSDDDLKMIRFFDSYLVTPQQVQNKEPAQTVEKSTVAAASAEPYSVKFRDYDTIIKHFKFNSTLTANTSRNIYLFDSIHKQTSKNYIIYRKNDKYLNLGPYGEDYDGFKILIDNFHKLPEELIKYTVLDKISHFHFANLKLGKIRNLADRNHIGESFGVYSDKSKELVFYKCPYFYVYTGLYINDEKWNDLINDFGKGRTIQELMMYADLDPMS